MYRKPYFFTTKCSFLPTWLFHQFIHNSLWIFILPRSWCFINFLLFDSNLFCKSSRRSFVLQIIKFKCSNIVFTRSDRIWFMSWKSITKRSEEWIWILLNIENRLFMNVILSWTRTEIRVWICWNFNFSFLLSLCFDKHTCNHRFCSFVLF